MQLLICRPVGWIEGYSVAEDEEDEALEQAVFGLGDGHSETGTLSANPAHSSLNDRMVIEWVHEDDCLVIHMPRSRGGRALGGVEVG